MERRPASHTEEEEMNQRRRLLNLARKGDPKAINRLFDLYQVRVYSGDNLKKVGKAPFAPPPHPSGKANARDVRARHRAATARRRLAARKRVKKAAPKKSTRKTARKTVKKSSRRAAHR